MLPSGPADERPQRNGWAPGDYICTCYLCGQHFQGAKRSVNCAPCAYAKPERDPAATLTKFVPGPLRFYQEHPSVQGGPAIVDADGKLVAALFWPGHKPEDTEAAELELYSIGRRMASVLGEW